MYTTQKNWGGVMNCCISHDCRLNKLTYYLCFINNQLIWECYCEIPEGWPIGGALLATAFDIRVKSSQIMDSRPTFTCLADTCGSHNKNMLPKNKSWQYIEGTPEGGKCLLCDKIVVSKGSWDAHTTWNWCHIKSVAVDSWTVLSQYCDPLAYLFSRCSIVH